MAVGRNAVLARPGATGGHQVVLEYEALTSSASSANCSRLRLGGEATVIRARRPDVRIVDEKLSQHVARVNRSTPSTATYFISSSDSRAGRIHGLRLGQIPKTWGRIGSLWV